MLRMRCGSTGRGWVSQRSTPPKVSRWRAAAFARHQGAAPETLVAVEPFPPVAAASVQYQPMTSQWSSTVPILLAAALSFGPAWFFKLKAESAKPRPTLEPWPEVPRPDADPRAYQLALARTRQALNVQKAVAFMKASEPSRAMVSLHRALEENAICRSPLLGGHLARGELRGLYKLHLLHTPVPHDFATLLQLRELLGIGAAEGEAIEAEVLEAQAVFSI